MKFFAIPPLVHLELASQATGGFYVLAHLYFHHEDYRQFVLEEKRKGTYLLLDNGAAENSLVTEDILIHICKELMPNEVIAPDVLFEAEQTKANLDSFIGRMAEENLLDKIDLFFCPQGRNREEWLDCYKYGLENAYVATIGMSKIAIPFAFFGRLNDSFITESRIFCVDHLHEKGLLQKPLHFLGGSHIDEFRHYLALGANLQLKHIFRSTDSCITILNGYYGNDMTDPNYNRPKTPHDYFEFKLNERQLELASKNILALKNTLSSFQ